MNKRWNFWMFVVSFSLAAGSLFSFGFLSPIGGRRATLSVSLLVLYDGPREQIESVQNPSTCIHWYKPYQKAILRVTSCFWVLVHNFQVKMSLTRVKINLWAETSSVISNEDSMPSLDESFTSDKLKIGYFTVLFLFNKLMDVLSYCTGSVPMLLKKRLFVWPCHVTLTIIKRYRGTK